MTRRDFLVRLDPENRGIGYFDTSLESVDRDVIIASHFGFLEMKFDSVGTFDRDYQLHFKAPTFSLTVFNDDESYPEFCENGYLDFAVFSFDTENGASLVDVLQRISLHFDIIEVPVKIIDCND